MKWTNDRRWTENDVAETGYRKKEWIDTAVARAMTYLTDPDKSKRLQNHKCVHCFYSGGRMAGQAFTEWNCRVCMKDQPDWPNTGTPVVCGKCSEKYKLCYECGADIYMRVRRANCKIIPDPTTSREGADK